MRNRKKWLVWAAILLGAFIIGGHDSATAWRMLNGAAEALFYWLLFAALINFYVWQRRYRALKSLERDGLLFLAILREKFGEGK